LENDHVNTSLRLRPVLEELEKRDCPALTLSVVSGTLLIQGTPTGPLAITEPAPGKIQVTDNSRNLGTFSVNENLIVNLASYPSTVGINLNGNRFGGNILMNLGLGGPPGGDTVSIAGGSLGGSLTILNGSGAENLFLGATTGGVSSPLSVGGPVSVTGRASGGTTTGGKTLDLFSGSTLAGNLSTALIDSLTLNGNVAGNLSVTDPGSYHALDVVVNGTVGKNANVTDSNLDDEFILASPSGQIGGNLSVNLGTSTGPTGDVIDLQTGTIVNGITTLTSAGGPVGGLFTVDGTINGNLTVNMGISGPAPLQDNFFTFAGTVFGNMQVTAGNGDNDLTNFTGTVFGNLSISMGNGNDSITVTNSPFGTFSLNAGNGSDSITLGTPAAASGNWTINFNFGTGSNTLTLGDGTSASTGNLFGYLNSQANPLANTFNQGGWSNYLYYSHF